MSQRMTWRKLVKLRNLVSNLKFNAIFSFGKIIKNNFVKTHLSPNSLEVLLTPQKNSELWTADSLSTFTNNRVAEAHRPEVLFRDFHHLKPISTSEKEHLTLRITPLSPHESKRIFLFFLGVLPGALPAPQPRGRRAINSSPVQHLPHLEQGHQATLCSVLLIMLLSWESSY